MSGSQLLLLGGVPAAVPVDPYFYSVTSLLHGDGTNGGQNNTFLDSSTNNFTITRNGNTTQGSFSPFSQTGWSNYFDGSTAYQTFPNSSAFAFGTGAFTIEGWVNSNGINDKFILSGRAAIGTMHITYGGFGGSTAGCLRYVGSSTITTGSALISNGVWNHFAVVRDGSNNITLYVNGVASATGTDTTNYTATTGTWYINANDSGPTVGGAGYISNLRINKGTAVYTSNFTPSTTPLTAISGTQLLTCQANRFLDASSNALTITQVGSPSVQPFSPFNPTTAYSTSSIGGSGYFDGSGDYLSIANNAAFNLGTNSFCIDGWFYPTTTNATQLVFNKWGTASDAQSMFQIGRISSTFYAQLRTTSGYVTLSTATWIPNAWNHFAVVRSGSTISAYLNGTRFGTDTSNPTLNSGTDTMTIGSKQAQDYFTGYISDCRIVNGSAIYDPTQTSITVPTAPTTAVTNTAFLSSSTNGAIFDNAAVADYETVGNAQISTSVKKYGTGSLAFDGAGDYIVAAQTQPLAPGTGDFCYELWLYLNSTGTACVFDTRTVNNNTTGFTLLVNGSAQLALYTNTTILTCSATLSASIWYHVAVTRTAGTIKVFLNGTQIGTLANTSNFSDKSFRVGQYVDGTGSLNGYVDDVRISNGISRYPYNFTPPTAEFPNIGGTVTLTADPYYEYTTLLLPGNGTNGAQNNTFLDSSTNAFTITRNGNTTQGTFSPFSQTGWGNYFDGSGDFLSFADNAAFAFGTGDFAIEFWWYPTVVGGTAGGLVDLGMNASGVGMWIGSEGNFNFRIASSEVIQILAANLPAKANQWNYIVGSRVGTTLRLFINGLEVGSASNSTSIDGTNANNAIGAYYAGGTAYPIPASYFSNVRILKGTGYTSVTVPTAPLTAITNTSLLTCQSNRFIDNSSNAFTITRNGDVSVQAFSPFNPTASWSAATYGGSGYFDGSGDYLTAANNAAFEFGSGNFTVESFFYSTSTGDQVIISRWSTPDSNSAWEIIYYAGTLYCQVASGSTVTTFTTTSFPLNQWNHIAFVRSGNTVSAFLNGSRFATATYSSTINAGNNGPSIGVRAGGTSFPFVGYISNTRVVKGTAVYDPTLTTLTVPTAPLTAITNTSLLLNYTNAGIYDATSKNDLETVGNAQISTTQSKFGGSSMYFDGTGDWLTAVASNPNFSFGSGDWTVEFWLYTAQTTEALLVAARNSGGGATNTNWYIYKAATTNAITLYVSDGSAWQISGIGGGNVSDSVWHHIAVTRYGSSFKVFVDGIQVGSTGTWSGTISSTIRPLMVGSDYSGSTALNGYIDDLRITKGIARYTSNFTPPTTAFLTL